MLQYLTAVPIIEYIYLIHKIKIAGKMYRCI